MKDILNSVFINVNEWLKFGESKNTVSLTVNGAGFFVLLQIFNSDIKIPDNLAKSLWVMAFFLLVSMVIHLISFLPKSRILPTRKQNSANGNLLFYGTIAKFTPRNYLSQLYLEFQGDVITACDKHELAIAEQIVINSEIALRKYLFFKIGMFCSTLGVLSAVFGFGLVGYQQLNYLIGR